MPLYLAGASKILELNQKVQEKRQTYCYFGGFKTNSEGQKMNSDPE